MSLADHEARKPGDIQYLEPGWHPVSIADFETSICKNENQFPMVKFTVEDAGGLKSKAEFFLTKAAMGQLTSFAFACGLSQTDLHNYDPIRPESHRILIGKRLIVRVIKEKKKYSKIDDWEPVGTNIDALAPSPYWNNADDQPQGATTSGEGNPF